MQLAGRIEGRHFVVVCTPRAAMVRIISARKANRREVRIYERRQEAGQGEWDGFVETIRNWEQGKRGPTGAARG